MLINELNEEDTAIILEGGNWLEHLVGKEVYIRNGYVVIGGQGTWSKLEDYDKAIKMGSLYPVELVGLDDSEFNYVEHE